MLNRSVNFEIHVFPAEGLLRGHVGENHWTSLLFNMSVFNNHLVQLNNNEAARRTGYSSCLTRKVNEISDGYIMCSSVVRD